MCQRSFCSQEQWLHKHVKWLHLVLWVITAVRKCGPCMQFIWNSQCRMRLAIAFSLWRVVLLQGSCKYATEFTKLCSCRRLHITTCWLCSKAPLDIHMNVSAFKENSYLLTVRLYFVQLQIWWMLLNFYSTHQHKAEHSC